MVQAHSRMLKNNCLTWCAFQNVTLHHIATVRPTVNGYHRTMMAIVRMIRAGFHKAFAVLHRCACASLHWQEGVLHKQFATAFNSDTFDSCIRTLFFFRREMLYTAMKPIFVHRSCLKTCLPNVTLVICTEHFMELALMISLVFYDSGAVCSPGS